ADEPTTALDVTVQAQILDLLEDLQADRQMTVIIVSHDLGVVASRTDRVMVMYAGEVCEDGSTVEVFESTRHPYTAALLRSMPTLSTPRGQTISPIAGSPPSLLRPPPGCRFAPRCRFAQPRCVEEHPSLVAGGTGHAHRCFF